MVKIKRSELEKRLAKSGGIAGFDAPDKDYIYGGSESDKWGIDDEEEKKKSLLDRAKDAAKTGGKFAKEVGKSVAGKYDRLGKGLAEVVAEVSGETDKQRKVWDDEQANATAGIRAATKALQDPKTTPEQRERWKKVLQLNAQRAEEAFQGATEKNKEVMSRTDPKKGGADVAGVGLDILSAGTYGTVAQGARTGQVLKSANIVRNAKRGVDATRGVNAAKMAGEGAVSGGLLGAGASVASQLAEEDNFSLAQTLKDATLGTVMGAVGGGLAGRSTNKAVAKIEEAKNAKTRALFGGVDETMDDVARGLEAEDAFKASQSPEGLVPENRRLGTGREEMQRQLDELDTQLDAFRKGTGDANSYNPAATIDGETADTLTAGRGLKPTKAGEVDKRAGGGKAAGTVAPTDTLVDSSARVTELRAMFRKRAELQYKIDQLDDPAPEGNLGEVMTQLADHPSAPKTVKLPGQAGKVAPSGDAPSITEGQPNPRVLRPHEEVPKTAKEIKALNKSPSFISEAFTSTRGKISGYGEAGQRIADGLEGMRNTSEIAQAAFVKQIPTVLKLRKKDFEAFVDALEATGKGQPIEVSADVRKAMAEWSRMIPAVRQAAVRAGVEVGDLGDSYFPRNYADLLSTNKGMTKAINHLVKTGQADNTVEARNMLEHMKTRYATPFGHFDNSRKLDLPDYDKGKDALVSYISGAFDKVAHAEEFGARGEKVAELFDTIGKTHGDKARERALDAYMIATGARDWGPMQDKRAKFSSAVRSFNRLRALGLSALMNAGQTSNTASLAGIWRTAGAALKVLSKSEREYIRDTGVVIDSVLNQLREQSGIGNKLVAKMTAPGFNQVETFNRSVAAEAGKMWANKLAAKAANGDQKAIATLRDKLGVTGEIDGPLTKAQQIQASRKLVQTAQFKVDAQDLPGWASSPEGKMVAQFKTFIYKQNGFIYNQLLKEAVQNKNPMPLIRFLAVGIPIGYTTGAIREKIKGVGENDVEGVEDKGKTTSQKIIGALSNVGAFGSFSDAGFLASNIKSQRFPQYLAGTFAGPTASFALETASNVSSGIASNPLDEEGNAKSFAERAPALTRQGLRSVPIVGNKMAKDVAPFKADVTQKQRDMLDEAPDPVKQDLYEFFGKMKEENSKTEAAKKVKKAVSSQNYNRGQRLADEHNAKIDQEIADLEGRIGEIPPDMLEYLESNYKINYEYYTRQDRKSRL